MGCGTSIPEETRREDVECDNTHCPNAPEFEINTWNENFSLVSHNHCLNCARVMYEENYSKSKLMPKFARVLFAFTVFAHR